MFVLFLEIFLKRLSFASVPMNKQEDIVSNLGIYFQQLRTDERNQAIYANILADTYDAFELIRPPATGLSRLTRIFKAEQTFKFGFGPYAVKFNSFKQGDIYLLKSEVTELDSLHDIKLGATCSAIIFPSEINFLSFSLVDLTNDATLLYEKFTNYDTLLKPNAYQKIKF